MVATMAQWMRIVRRRLDGPAGERVDLTAALRDYLRGHPVVARARGHPSSQAGTES